MPQPTTAPSQWITVSAAAAECGVTRRTIINWIASGKLKVETRHGDAATSPYVISRESLDAAKADQ